MDRLRFILLVSCAGWAAHDSPAMAAEADWVTLSGADHFASWQAPTGRWIDVGDVAYDPSNARRLVAKEGTGVMMNGPTGKTSNLVSKQQFRDCEVHAEFVIPKHSNSGVKLMGLYEIQILDSQSAERLTGDSCGGIYPRAKEKPRYHHIDNGFPPRVNAARPAGQWQTLDITFRAPRFDSQGQKTAAARFVRVTLNGQLIHANVDVKSPTGSAWMWHKEVPAGPLLLQADHGPVAFRNVRVRPVELP
jgi:hypothetical protein